MVTVAVTIPSESDIVALHLYVFDRENHDVYLSYGLELLKMIMHDRNPAFPDDFVARFCSPHVNTEVKIFREYAQGGSSDAAQSMTGFLRHNKKHNLRVFVQQSQFALPNKPAEAKKAWLVTFATNAIGPARAEDAELQFVQMKGGLGDIIFLYGDGMGFGHGGK